MGNPWKDRLVIAIKFQKWKECEPQINVCFINLSFCKPLCFISFNHLFAMVNIMGVEERGPREEGKGMSPSGVANIVVSVGFHPVRCVLGVRHKSGPIVQGYQIRRDPDLCLTPSTVPMQKSS